MLVIVEHGGVLLLSVGTFGVELHTHLLAILVRDVKGREGGVGVRELELEVEPLLARAVPAPREAAAEERAQEAEEEKGGRGEEEVKRRREAEVKKGRSEEGQKRE